VLDPPVPKFPAVGVELTADDEFSEFPVPPELLGFPPVEEPFDIAPPLPTTLLVTVAAEQPQITANVKAPSVPCVFDI
jgi:hypothetical protein